jgi:hypothetical protein
VSFRIEVSHDPDGTCRTELWCDDTNEAEASMARTAYTDVLRLVLAIKIEGDE